MISGHTTPAVRALLGVISYSLLACSVLVAGAGLAGCSQSANTGPQVQAVRDELERLRQNEQLASQAPLAVSRAILAVQAAEQPQRDAELARHLLFVADREVNIAWAQAQFRAAVAAQQQLHKARDVARLDARTKEADSARQQLHLTQQELLAARRQTADAQTVASAASADARLAQQQASDLQAEIKLLNARWSERGWVVTLGDLLFDTGKAELKAANDRHLAELAVFLGTHPLYVALIEGHTDSIGTASYNLALSQQRAEAVRTFLLDHGITASRLRVVGKGETNPVSTDESATGRQQNRRVEVIISEGALAVR